MTPRRLKRRLFWTCIVLALVMFYVAISVVRLGVSVRDLITRNWLAHTGIRSRGFRSRAHG